MGAAGDRGELIDSPRRGHDGRSRRHRRALRARRPGQRPEPAAADRARPALAKPPVDVALLVEEVAARRHDAHELVALGVVRQADGAALPRRRLPAAFRGRRRRRLRVGHERGGAERALDVVHGVGAAALAGVGAAARGGGGDDHDQHRDGDHRGDLERERDREQGFEVHAGRCALLWAPFCW